MLYPAELLAPFHDNQLISGHRIGQIFLLQIELVAGVHVKVFPSLAP
jgi:hypothetical protein